MATLKKILKASTLLETIVAMVIIMICSGIGFDLFSGISKNINDEMRIKAELRMNSFAMETKYKRNFTDTAVVSAGIRLERTFSEYKDRRRLFVLSIEAFSLNGEKICSYNEIVEGI